MRQQAGSLCHNPEDGAESCSVCDILAGLATAIRARCMAGRVQLDGSTGAPKHQAVQHVVVPQRVTLTPESFCAPGESPSVGNICMCMLSQQLLGFLLYTAAQYR
jgi:hypothetical protein